MLNFSGLFSILFLISIVAYLIRTTPEFNFKQHTVSHLGTFQKTKNTFLITLLIYTLLRLIFFSILFTKLALWGNYLIVLAFIVAFGSFIATAFITLAVNQKIHSLTALTSAISTCILIFLLGIVLFRLSAVVGIINMFLANTMLWGSWLLARNKGTNSYFQSFYMANVFIWDICMVLFLIKYGN
jgi:hypothetical protein